MKSKSLKIFNNYGYKNQLKKLNEEVYEFVEAALLYENGKGNMNHVIEELGDVEFLLYQFRNHYKIRVRKIMSVRRFKARRQLKRIEKEMKEKKRNEKDINE